MTKREQIWFENVLGKLVKAAEDPVHWEKVRLELLDITKNEEPQGKAWAKKHKIGHGHGD